MAVEHPESQEWVWWSTIAWEFDQMQDQIDQGHAQSDKTTCGGIK